MLEWDERMRAWAVMGERGGRPQLEEHGYRSVLSVGQRLIELEYRNGFGIGGLEPAALVELEDTLGRRPSRRQWRGSGGESEMREDGVNGNGVRNEGDDVHRSTARRAEERENIIDASDEGAVLPRDGPLTPERDDLIPELGIGSQHPVIAVTMDAWRGDEQSESLKELEGGERESGAAARCGMRKTIDDALASVPGSLEPFEGEGRTGTVA